jgi:hypothetical protein
MRGHRFVRSAVVVLACACLVAPPVALGALVNELNNVRNPVIYLSSGIHDARLGMTDAKVKTRVGFSRVGTKKDTSYAGQTVYKSWFGKRIRAGVYAVMTYSNSKHVVWMFEINSSAPKTRKGIHVGSTAAALEKAYGTALTKTVGDKATTYTYGTVRGKGTDFYVNNGTKKITQIIVRNW